MSNPIYSLGALVKVSPESRTGRPNSEGGLAFVVVADEQIDVKYVLDSRLSQDVEPTRLIPASLATTARRRNTEETRRPSILSVAHGEHRRHVVLHDAEKMEETVVQALALGENPTKQAHVRFQWDNTTPHIDGDLLTFLEIEFDRRGWELVPQPPNSPLTNVQDACLFPAMAKRVTEEQGLEHSGQYLQGEHLWTAVRKVWDTYPASTIARSFMHHGQVVNAMYACEGRDDFVKDSKSLHCNVRKVVHPIYHQNDPDKPSGVEVFEHLEPADVERELRYNTPNVSAKNPAHYLKQKTLTVLANNIEPSEELFAWFAEAEVEALEADDNN